MRHGIHFALIIGVFLVHHNSTLAYHDNTCHPAPPPTYQDYVDWGYVPPALGLINLILVDPGTGQATSASCSASGDDHVDVAVPPDALSAIEHVPGAGQPGRFWLFEPTSQSFRDARVGLSAEVPNFTKPDGTPLLTQYNETNLDFLLSVARTFIPGETFTVSAGEIGGWPGATLREMPPSFTLDELLAADPSLFRPYGGPAEVADISTIRVIPEPTAFVLLLLGITPAVVRRHR